MCCVAWGGSGELRYCVRSSSGCRLVAAVKTSREASNMIITEAPEAVIAVQGKVAHGVACDK